MHDNFFNKESHLNNISPNFMSSIFLQADKTVSPDIKSEHLFLTSDEHFQTLSNLVSSYYNSQELDNDIIKRQQDHKKNLA